MRSIVKKGDENMYEWKGPLRCSKLCVVASVRPSVCLYQPPCRRYCCWRDKIINIVIIFHSIHRDRPTYNYGSHPITALPYVITRYCSSQWAGPTSPIGASAIRFLGWLRGTSVIGWWVECGRVRYVQNVGDVSWRRSL